jgi:hypothetical protein
MELTVGLLAIGLAGVLGKTLKAYPLLRPAAVAMPLGFAWLAGSGMAATQSPYGFFVAPARSPGEDPVPVGAVVSLSAAAGRTESDPSRRGANLVSKKNSVLTYREVEIYRSLEGKTWHPTP